MRPPSIVLFEKVFLAAIVLGLINSLLFWGSMTEVLDDPAMKAAGMGTGFMLVSVVIGTTISLLLWYFIARRASNVAKWIFVVILALGVFGMVANIANPAVPKGAQLVGGFVSLLLQLYAGWLLFKPDAKVWLESRGTKGASDPSVFD
jgi:hypothetical protein